MCSACRYYEIEVIYIPTVSSNRHGVISVSGDGVYDYDHYQNVSCHLFRVMIPCLVSNDAVELYGERESSYLLSKLFIKRKL